MNAYQRFVRWWGRYPSFAWVGRTIITRLDTLAYGKRTSITTMGTDFPLCYLITTGRKTGEARTTPLLFVDHDTGVVVTGTNFGAGNHPAWALNLVAEPRAELLIDGTERPVRARLLTEFERLAVWPKLTGVWPGFDDYVARSGRTPMTFVLEPPTGL